MGMKPRIRQRQFRLRKKRPSVEVFHFKPCEAVKFGNLETNCDYDIYRDVLCKLRPELLS